MANSSRAAKSFWLFGILIGVALGAAGTAKAAPAPSLESLTYSIRTTYDAGGGCGNERLTNATIGIPALINVGGNFLPDVSVVLVALPPTDGTPAVLQILITRLRDYKGAVETIVAPSAGAPKRFAFGYDGCESGVPATFSATMTASATRVSVNATTLTNHPNLKVLGSFYDQEGATRANPTAIVARLAPVPLNLSAVVDIVGDTYHATLETTQPTHLGLDYTSVNGASRTEATVDVDQLPKSLVVDFDPERVAYAASCSLPAPQLRARVDLSQSPPSIDITLTRYGDGSPCRIAAMDFDITTEKAGTRTARLDGQLRGLPAVADLQRTSPTRMLFNAPGTIDSATIGFASFIPGTTLPVLEELADQYVVADVDLAFSVAQVRLFGLSKADVDTGDPVVVDIAHTAGPFHVVAQVTSPAVIEPPQPQETRDLSVDVLDLPAEAKVTYSPKTQSFSYRGSGVIGDLVAEVISDIALVDDAHRSRLHIVGLPTGLEGQLDSKAKTFTAGLIGGAIGALEIEVTSGPDLRSILPGDQQGVAVQDTNDSYAAFVRITGVREVAVGWGTTQHAHLVHTPGPFIFRVDVDDSFQDSVQDDDIVFRGDVLDLPATATLTFAPADESVDRYETKLTYDGSDAINRLTLDVVREIDDPIARDPNEAHVAADGVPRHLELVVNNAQETMEATTKPDDPADGPGDPLAHLDLELCTTNGCQPTPASGTDRLDVLDRLLLGETGQYRAFARITGLRSVTANWSEKVSSLTFDKAPGRFDIRVDKDIVEEFDRPAGGWPDGDAPNPPCMSTPKPAWCEPDASPRRKVYWGFPTLLTVAIDQLPATGYVSYNRETHRVEYRGAAVIDSLVADYSSQFKRFPPRARWAHLDIRQLPTNLTLTFALGEGGKHVVMDTGGGVLGHLDFWLTNTENVVPNLPFDGFALHDGCPETRSCVVADEFELRAKVTRLTHFDYREIGQDASHTERTIDLQRSADPAGRGETIWLLVTKKDVTKHDELARFFVIYADPPPSFKVVTDEEPSNTSVGYWGARGGSLLFETNAGENRSFLEARIVPVPASTATQEGVAVCMAPSHDVCSHEQTNGGHDEMSFSVNVTEPITLSLIDCKEVNAYWRCQDDEVTDREYRNTLLRVDNLHIARSLVVMKEKVNVEWDVDNANVHVDTAGQPVHGEITSTRRLFASNGWDPELPDQWITQVKLHVLLPVGFLAHDRFGEIDCTPPSGCSWHDNTTHSGLNTAACPAGFEIEVKVTPVYLPNFEDEFCPAPIIHSVELAGGGPAAVAQGTTATVRVRGERFSPGPFLDLLIPALGHDDQIVISDVQWHSLNEVTFNVAVSCDAVTFPTDKRDLYMENPIEGHNDTTAPAAFTVLPGDCGV